MLRAIRVLRALSGAGGGWFFQTSKGHPMEEGFNLIAEILQTQYALEFQPAGVSPGREGNRIKIKCSRPGVEVTAPEDY